MPTRHRAMPVSRCAMAQLARSISKPSYRPHRPARLATAVLRRLVVVQDRHHEQLICALLGSPPWWCTSTPGEKPNQMSNDSLSVLHLSPADDDAPSCSTSKVRTLSWTSTGGPHFHSQLPQRAIRHPSQR